MHCAMCIIGSEIGKKQFDDKFHHSNARLHSIISISIDEMGF